MWLIIGTAAAGWLVVGWSVIHRLAVRSALRWSQRFPRLPAEPFEFGPAEWMFVPLWPCAVLGDWLFWHDKIGPDGRALPYR